MRKNPPLPDLVEIWAVEECARSPVHSGGCVNDNDADWSDELSDPLIELFARMDIAENRVW